MVVLGDDDGFGDVEIVFGTQAGLVGAEAEIVNDDVARGDAEFECEAFHNLRLKPAAA